MGILNTKRTSGNERRGAVRKRSEQEGSAWQFRAGRKSTISEGLNKDLDRIWRVKCTRVLLVMGAMGAVTQKKEREAPANKLRSSVAV